MTHSAGTAWGPAREMTDLEAVFWRAEVDPQLRSGGVVLDLLDQAPDWERLVAGHRWAITEVPRLRDRVVEDASRLGAPRWVPADVDLGYHLTRVRLPDGSDQSALYELVAALHMEPLDPHRPLWRAVVVEGLADGTAAYLLKIHHSMADGTAAMQLFDLLHGATREPRGPRLPADVPPVDAIGPQGVAAERIRSLVSAAPSAVARGLSGARRVLGSVINHPERVVSAAVTASSYAASAMRVTSGSGASPSPLLVGRGLARRVNTLEVPLADLKAAGRAAEGTLNDAFLAGLLGGLGRYHVLHGTAVGDLPIALPVSLRDTHTLGGNCFAAASIAGPAGETDPVRRIALLHARVTAARSETALDLMGAFAPVASRLPAPLLAKAARRMSSSLDLQASSITGLDRDAYLAGARITRMFVFGPVPGSAIMATLLSHQGICCIAITTDHDAVPDPDVLAGCLREGFDEVLALGRTQS